MPEVEASEGVEEGEPVGELERATLLRSLADLEWPELTERIAGLAVSALGGARIRLLAPLPTAGQAAARQTLFHELLGLSTRDAMLPVGELSDLASVVARARRHGVASGPELGAVLRVLRLARGVARFVEAHQVEAPRLAAHLALPPGLAGLERELSRALDETGEVLDTASSELAAARASARRLQREAQRRIGDLVRRYRDALQDGYYAERDGRYVLPVRTDAPHRVEGLVLGTSASGSTLYVEPTEMGRIGNELRMAEAEVERELSRVLAEQSALVGAQADAVLEAQEVCVEADALGAVVRFAQRIEARVVGLCTEAVLELRGARHPLLAARGIEVVPSDLSLAAGRGLVLSGPNAGGKTVAMKCVGLLALLQASGLPVPVGAGSRLGFFARVFADIGDDQSLSRSLSTFSGHVERVRDVLSLSAGDSLVLLDELMGGTDPGEGTVLGVAALDALVARGAAVVVTTHYDGLKDHASSSEVLDNAAVGFDFSRMAPTFRVEQGRPGASSALAIAGRHGLPPQLLLRAEALLPEVERRRREDRIAIEQLRAELERERGELERERAELARQGRVLEQRAERLEEQRRSELARERDALLVDVRQARSEVRQLRTRMRHGPEAGGSRELERELDAAASLVALGSGVDQRLRGESPAAAESPALAVGSQVRVRGTAAVLVVLEEPRKGRVRVASGAMKLTVAVAELELVDARAARAEARPVRAAPRPAARPAAALDEPPAKTTDVCLDLRGRRVEESLDAVDAFLDDLLRRHESGGYILHGHGTGALKDALRSHLKGHPAVRAARPAEREEGGDAWTVVWLAGSD